MQLIQEVTRFHLCLYRFEAPAAARPAAAASAESVGTSGLSCAHACKRARTHNGVTARDDIEQKENNRLAKQSNKHGWK